MKKLFAITASFIFIATLFAQIPQKMSYQAIIRNSSGQLVTSHAVGIKISILQGSASGTVVSTETQTANTNANGLVSIEIGGSSAFNAINWANGPYYIKTETDPNGGTSYTIAGASQLLTVPYALYSKKAEIDNVNDADADPTNEIQTISLSGTNLALSKNGGTVTLPSSGGGDNWGTQIVKTNSSITGQGTDASPLGVVNSVLSPSWSNILNIPAGLADGVDNVDDADNNSTNEIQVLSISGSTLNLSNGGGTVALPSSGGGDNWGTQTVLTNATITGNGTTPSPLKIAQQSATSGQILKWNGSDWKPANDETGGGGGAPTGAAGGDLSGTYPNPVINFPFAKSLNLGTTPFSISNSGTSVFTISGISSQFYGIYGETAGSNGAGVYGRGSGSGFSAGVMGIAEMGYPAVPSTTTCGIRGLANVGVGVMGYAFSGIGGQFFSSTGKALVTTQGGVQFQGLGEAAGKVLTSDALGNATWQTAGGAAVGWSLTGNAGTIPGTNFIGTTDDVDLAFRRNNIISGRISSTNTSFGNSALSSITSGFENTATGAEALRSNTIGHSNTATGRSALYSNTTGIKNTANGMFALITNTTGNQNTANGMNALYSNTTGSDNTANGINSLYSNTTGSVNSANGAFTLQQNTTGSSNTANGAAALSSNTIGNFNTANGANALHSNTTGFNNTATGANALYSNTTGAHNTANGTDALTSNTTGYTNTANGEQALYSNTTGYRNTANGVSSLFSNTTGNENTALGTGALSINTTGNNNTAAGSASLNWNTTGNGNSGIGFLSLTLNSTGSNNSALGMEALRYNTTGEYNVASGQRALFTNVSGGYNTAIGIQSLYLNSVGFLNTAVGSGALYNATGSNNTGIGVDALRNITTGANNTALGWNAQVPTPTASNQVRIGNASVTYAGVQVAWTIGSDRRWKTDIKSSDLGLKFITALKPVSYVRINDDTKKAEYGFIAQEVDETLKSLDATENGIITIDDAGMYNLRYNDLIAPLVKAMQEQQKIIENQQTQIIQLKDENTNIKTESANLKAELESRLTKIEAAFNLVSNK